MGRIRVYIKMTARPIVAMFPEPNRCRCIYLKDLHRRETPEERGARVRGPVMMRNASESRALHSE
jgi:hypothetical protein